MEVYFQPSKSSKLFWTNQSLKNPNEEGAEGMDFNMKRFLVYFMFPKVKSQIKSFLNATSTERAKSTKGWWEEEVAKVICLSHEVGLSWLSRIHWEIHKKCRSVPKENWRIGSYQEICLFDTGVVSLLLLRNEFSYICARHYILPTREYHVF